MRKFVLAAALALLVSLSLAGWSDLSYSCPETFQDFHQGRPVNLSLNVSNFDDTNGGAVYVLNITLHLPSCVNGGQDITIPGGIICTSADFSCRNRHPDPTNRTFTFANLTTDPECANGLNSYSFTLSGNNEYVDVGSRWSTTTMATNTTPCYMRFIGADVCGDGTCAPVENCTTCESDCSRCPECSGSGRACRNNSVMECVNGFYTRTVQSCSQGCDDLNGTVACRRSCDEGAARCADNRTLQTCIGGDWQNETCVRACINNACVSDTCYGITCPDKCEAGTFYSNGACNPASASCSYFTTTPCSYGCEGSICRTTPLPTPTPTPAPGTKIPCVGSIGMLLAAFLLLVKQC